jgi:hypothetical protein
MGRKQGHVDLEARWRRNRKPHKRERVSHSFVQIKDGVAEHQHAERSGKLTADYFVRELARLATEWQEEQFLKTIQLLFDLELVEEIKGGRFRWTRKKGPAAGQITDREQARERVHIEQVRMLVSRGVSERAACMQVAVGTGYPGKTLEHASDRLRRHYRLSRQQSNDR